MDNVLHQNLVSFKKWLMNCNFIKSDPSFNALFRLAESDAPVRRKCADVMIFVMELIIDLSLIYESISERQSDKSVVAVETEKEFFLSLDQKKIISSTLQFIIVLAVSPYLNEGVGIPISQRLGPGQILLASNLYFSKDLNEPQRLKYLLSPLHLLVLTFHSLFKHLIVKSHISDLIASLIQVRRTSKLILLHQGKCSNCDEKELHPKFNIHINNQGQSQSENQILISSCASPSLSTPESHTSIIPIEHEYPPYFGNSFEEVISYCNNELDMLFTCHNSPAVLQEMLTMAGMSKVRLNMYI